MYTPHRAPLTLAMARAQAKRFSSEYCTFWYVKQLGAQDYAAWAHSDNSAAFVSTFYCGREVKEGE